MSVFDFSKEHKKRLLTILIAIVCVLIVLISILIWYFSFSYVNETKEYETVAEQVVTEVESTETSDSLIEIDFSKLNSLNEDIYAWLYIPGTNISYPVVQGVDNETYLEFDSYKNVSSLGSLYLNFNNNTTMTDYKSIIYGHNMRNGTMFHDLISYSDEDYGNEHSKAYLYLENGDMKTYTLLYSAIVDPLDLDVYALRDDATIESSLEYLLSVSDTTYSEGTNTGNILILSTCSNDSSKRRIVVFQEI